MLLNASGDSISILDFSGNTVLVYGYEESPHASALTDPATPLNVQPVGQTGFGDPVFSDEFKAASLNTSKWETQYPDTSFWNATTPGGNKTNTDEPQGYDASGISFDEDGMVLTFREDNAAVPELAYTSGMVTSYSSFNTTYGYFEARMLLPNVDDAWPAFWLFPTDQNWPPELDIAENDSQNSYNLQTYHTFHYPSPTPGGNSSTVYDYPEDVGANWHVFGALWEPERIRWYVDGDLAKDLTIDSTYADGDMFMICNLAGAKESTPVAPFSLKISHIRVWEL